MTLTFPKPPFVKEPEGRPEVWLQGRDTKTKDDVEIRVAQPALRQRCGAKGLTNRALLDAFEKHRETIVKAVDRKYAAGRTERLDDRIVVRLDIADL